MISGKISQQYLHQSGLSLDKMIITGVPRFDRYVGLNKDKKTKELIKQKLFNHFKFKSMKSGIEHGRVFFEQDRINRFGRFLRRYHLDELPELFLILLGKMSFVGPRALPKKLLSGLDYSKRQTTLPGLTCLAQIYLIRNGQINKKLQIKLDNYYLRHKSFKYNIKIILATFAIIFKSKTLNMNQNLNEDRKQYLI